MLLHATCISIHDKGVLIVGPAGAGKSDLALRMIDAGAQLVSDDQTELQIKNGVLTASPPSAIAGLFEARHIGLMRLPHLASATVDLYVDLVPADEKLPRLPDTAQILLLDRSVTRLRLPSFAASTPAKIRAALQYPLVTDIA